MKFKKLSLRDRAWSLINDKWQYGNGCGWTGEDWVKRAIQECQGQIGITRSRLSDLELLKSDLLKTDPKEPFIYKYSFINIYK